VDAQESNLPAPVSVEAEYLAALLEEVRGLRADIKSAQVPVTLKAAPATKKKAR
jgi:hypothetical protein